MGTGLGWGSGSGAGSGLGSGATSGFGSTVFLPARLILIAGAVFTALSPRTGISRVFSGVASTAATAVAAMAMTRNRAFGSRPAVIMWQAP
ncbi:MAG TPA: hypothetical protein DCF82_09070 [Marinobacter hydrocarbonoclasticus]|uniref:Uncharacterized protein n=1 Tax=Marinobacter nauticus TaxID=2743 RepID=A0A3B8WDI1_MARNT|nr:hypothetical protein [Marinobacter nauticus]